MKVWKFAVIAGCVCALPMPSMAQVKFNNPRNAASAKAGTDETDMSQIKLSKKAYVDEITKSFELMDTNGDGYIDAKELSTASEQGVHDPKNPLDDSELDSAKELKQLQEFQARNGVAYTGKPIPRATTTAPASPQSVSPATGIPPINSDQLIKK